MNINDLEIDKSKADELREILRKVHEESLKKRIKGGLIVDPTRQLTKNLYELEKRIEKIEERLTDFEAIIREFAEPSLSELLSTLIEEPNQTIAVVAYSPFIHNFARDFVAEVSGTSYSHSNRRLLNLNGSKVYFFDIDAPESLKGFRFNSSIIVGESKHPILKDILKSATTVGESPTIFELKSIYK
jgi:hypothetical protein